MNEINCRIENTTGIITLQRTKALNALTYEMCQEMENSLNQWEENSKITQVMIEAEGEKAFCAGGDVAKLYHKGIEKKLEYIQNFWKDEYRLNALIANYSKPYIAFMHGYTMGGGVGVSCHGSHRIVGESTKIAMPECAIGLIPDVGGTLLLSKAPGNIGEFLGTTGIRIEAEDTIKTGFSDYFVHEKRWPELKKQLIESGNTNSIKDFHSPPPKLENSIFNKLDLINKFFSIETADEIKLSLTNENSEWSNNILDAWKKNSPLSILCTIALIRNVRKMPSIEFALEKEYLFTSQSIEHGDFLEGVRAALIDKDHKPKWKHKDFKEIKETEIKKMLN